jgi:hypothetical protein
MITH